jgi:hypothetical protein
VIGLEAAKDFTEVKSKLGALMESASPIEMHCAKGMCQRDGVDPEKPVRGFPLWLHFLPTVRNVLVIRDLANEFEAAR